MRPSGDAPDDVELELLAALASRARLVAALPGGAPAVIAGAPEDARAGRAGAIQVGLDGGPHDTVTVRLVELGGVLDSVRVALDETGAGRAAFRVVPDRTGWHDWVIDARGVQAPAGAWVREAKQPHVLVVAGPPDWESRFVMRALEETGATIMAAQPLGRGLSFAGGSASLPSSAEGLAAYDVVIVLSSAVASAAQLRALDEYATRLGGGVLVAAHGPAAAALGVASVADAGAATNAERLSWSVPAELAPLPLVALDVRVHAVEPMVPTAVPAAVSPGGPVFVLAPLGRGRAGILGIGDSWRWRMEAGRMEEHRVFWRSLVDWLASGARDTVSIRPAQRRPAIARRLLVTVEEPAETVRELMLRRPDGSEEALPLARAATVESGVSATALLAATPGVHELRVPGTPTAAAFMAYDGRRSTATEPAHAWARLTLLAYASGGVATNPDRLDSMVDSLRAAAGPSGSPARRDLVLFALIVALALGEWTVRRIRGLP